MNMFSTNSTFQNVDYKTNVHYCVATRSIRPNPEGNRNKPHNNIAGCHHEALPRTVRFAAARVWLRVPGVVALQR